MKIYMVSLLHRATINYPSVSNTCIMCQNEYYFFTRISNYLWTACNGVNGVNRPNSRATFLSSSLPDGPGEHNSRQTFLHSPAIAGECYMFWSCNFYGRPMEQGRLLYFCPVVSFFFFFFFIHRRISAVTDWMSTILPQIVWP